MHLTLFGCMQALQHKVNTPASSFFLSSSASALLTPALMTVGAFSTCTVKSPPKPLQSAGQQHDNKHGQNFGQIQAKLRHTWLHMQKNVVKCKTVCTLLPVGRPETRRHTDIYTLIYRLRAANKKWHELK